MQLCAQWWLVITNPSGETNEPEQPPASRTEESCASESHFPSGPKPYFFATFALGKLSNVHMPSSARAASGSAAARQKAANRFMSAPRDTRRAAGVLGSAGLVPARPRAVKGGDLRRRDGAEQPGEALDLGRQLGIGQPVGGEVALRAQVGVELRVAAVERRRGADRLEERDPRAGRLGEPLARQLQRAARRRELLAVVKAQVLAPADHRERLQEPRHVLRRLLDLARAGRL